MASRGARLLSREHGYFQGLQLPGNSRELENISERAMIRAGGKGAYSPGPRALQQFSVSLCLCGYYSPGACALQRQKNGGGPDA